jgi:putative tricarboxylic transport membrane protein
MGIKIFAKLVEIRKGLLLPIIIIISVVGTYAINNSITDVYWMLGFGIFGYILKMYGFQMGPVVLGIILGPLMEENYRRAMMDQHNNVIGFFFQREKPPFACTNPGNYLHDPRSDPILVSDEREGLEV